MTKICLVCDCQFRNGDKIVAVMLSNFIQLDSDATFAIDHPSKCLEIMHVECYDGPLPDEQSPIGEING